MIKCLFSVTVFAIIIILLDCALQQCLILNHLIAVKQVYRQISLYVFHPQEHECVFLKELKECFLLRYN